MLRNPGEAMAENADQRERLITSLVTYAGGTAVGASLCGALLGVPGLFIGGFFGFGISCVIDEQIDHDDDWSDTDEFWQKE